MSPGKLEKIKEEMFITGYLNGALDSSNEYVKRGLDELVEYQAKMAYRNWKEEQVEQEARNRE